MRECYSFDDDKTEVWLGGDVRSSCNRYISVCTKDENGTQIELTRRADELVEK